MGISQALGLLSTELVPLQGGGEVNHALKLIKMYSVKASN